jgi:hypothetical protein
MFDPDVATIPVYNMDDASCVSFVEIDMGLPQTFDGL